MRLAGRGSLGLVSLKLRQVDESLAREPAASCRAGGFAVLLEPAEQRVVAAVHPRVLDSGAGADLSLELLEVACGRNGGAAPAGHGEDAGEIDGLGIGHDCCDVIG